MNPIIVHVGRGAPLRRSNVDTDQIVPAEYLKRVTRTGFADGCFAAWRREADFVLNQPQYAGASVLVAGPDFGTGSSREHAVWALQDFGFAVVLSSRFADIFRGNAGKAGLLAAEVPQPVVERMWVSLERSPEDEVHVDLRDRTVSIPRQGITASLQIDDYTRWRLMEGLDDIALTLRHTDRIDRFEARRPPFTPTTLPRLAESDAPESLLPRGGIPKFH